MDHVAVNASGTMVSVLVSSKEHAAEGKMFVYCSETNSTVVYDFAKVWASGVGGVGGDEGGKQQRTRGMLEGIGSPVVRQVLVTQPRNRIGFIIPLHAAHMPPSLHTHTPSPPAHPAQDGRTPQAMMWDVVESKLLAVQTLVGGEGRGEWGVCDIHAVHPPAVHPPPPLCTPMQSQQRDELDEATATGQYITEVALLFVSPDHGVLMQEYQSISATGERRVCVCRGVLMQERVSERANQAASVAPRADLPSLFPPPSVPAPPPAPLLRCQGVCRAAGAAPHPEQADNGHAAERQNDVQPCGAGGDAGLCGHGGQR